VTYNDPQRHTVGGLELLICLESTS